MALALFDRVQETTTTTGTGSVTLGGAVPGFQSFAVVGNGNTCYYTIVDGSAWEVGVGTYSTSGPTLARTTILSNSNGNTSAITLAAGTKSVFLTYPASKSVNLNESGNVSPLGTVSSGVWQGTTVGVAYGGTGVTASSGANSVMLRDANQNVSINRLNQSNTNITAAAGTTLLTAASSYSQTLVGTGNQTIRMPDATLLATGVAFEFNNNATGTLTLTDYASATIGTVTSGGAVELVLLSNGTVGGTWDVHGYIPENVTWGTNALNLGSTVISGGTWQGGTIATGYGGTGLTSYTSGGAVYANSSTTLTSGTLPVTAGGTGATTAAGAQSNLNVPSTTGSGASGTWGISITGSAGSLPNAVTFNSGGSGDASGTSFNGAAARTISYNTIGAPSTSGANASGTWNISITGAASSATNATNSTYLASQDIRTLSPSSTAATRLAFGFTSWANNNSSPWADYLAMRSYPDASGGNDNLLVLNKSTIAMRVYQQAWGSASAYSSYADVLMSNNYNSYTPTLTGTGATGTWNINITGSAGTAGSVDYNALTNKGGGTGSYITSGDYRAPIFYDSNDTTYYVDPATGTYLFGSIQNNGAHGNSWIQNRLLAGNNGAATGEVQLRMWCSEPDVTWDWAGFGFNVRNDGGTPNGFSRPNTSFGQAYMRMSPSGDWYFYNTTTGASRSTTMRLDSTGYVVAYNSSRAPIFYDTDDTSYYVDPNATSSLRSVNYWGLQQWAGNDVYAIGTPTYGFRFNNNANTINAFVIDNSGNTTSYASSRAPIFYDSNNTAYYVDPASGSNLYNVTIRGAAFSMYTGSYGMQMYSTADGAGNPGGWARSTNFANGTTSVNFASFGALGSGDSIDYAYLALGTDPTNYASGVYLRLYSNYTQASGSMRAPIFYDSNDTGYYVDPNGTSYLNVVGSAGRFYTGYDSGQTNSFSCSNWFRSSGDTGWYNASYAGGIYMIDSTWVRVYNNKQFYSSNYIESGSSVRAPIFYDSNDTAFYVDPNSASNLNLTYTKGLAVDGYGASSSYAAVRAIPKGAASSFPPITGAIKIRLPVRANDSMWQMTVKIYNYDSNSLSEYIVGSYSYATGAYNYGAYFTGSGNSTPRDVRVGNDGSYDCVWIGETNTSWSYPVIAVTDFFAGYSNGTAAQWDDNWDISVVTSFTGSQSLVTPNTKFNAVTAVSAMYAPIYYDSNDTNFYVDPASTSVMQVGRFRKNQTAGDYTTAALWTESFGNTATGIAFHISGNVGRFLEMRTNGLLYWNGTMVADTDFRAPIFYDSNNTGYYVDPASGSNFAGTITINGGKLLLNSDSGGFGQFQINSSNTSTEATIVFGSGGSGQNSGGYTYGGAIGLGAYGLSKANLYFGAGYSSPSMFIPNGSAYVEAINSFRAPIFYDSNNTAYYGDFASTSRINTINFDQLNSQGYNNPNQLVTASDTNWTYGCFNSGSTYFMQVKFYGTGDDSRGFRVLDTSNSVVVWRVNGAGNSIASGNVTAYSDERLKTNWQSMPENYVSRLAQIKVGIYDRIDGSKLTQVGVGAQSLEELLPQAVDKADDEMGTLSVNYGGAALASAVELAKYVTALEQRISQLEARL